MEDKSPLIKPDVEERINQLLAKMTINEKIGQLNQIHDFSTAQQDAIRQGQIGSIINAPGALTGLGSSASTKAEVVNSLQKTAIQESRLGIPILIYLIVR